MTEPLSQSVPHALHHPLPASLPPSAIEVSATVRLQFHRNFTLDDAAALVPYFSRLGISHVYASPLLTARAGSMHGYDVVDPTRINPELGGEPALMRLAEELRKHNMGLILDIVPNHMAVGGNDNPWWLDVLEWGPASPYATFFDIEWQSHDPLMQGRLLIPFLSADYGDVLAAGEITVHYDASAGAFYAAYQDHCFPLFPPSCADILEASERPALRELARTCRHLEDSQDMRRHTIQWRAQLRATASDDDCLQDIGQCLLALNDDSQTARDRLHQLLEQQHYRLASWRTASDDINWRRFFDINELAGLRIENAAVFDATHEKIFALIQSGQVNGLRIDHIDGLAEPRAYCRKLRRRVDRLQHDLVDTQTARFPLYVEKILLGNEELPRDWQVTGTTGYEFMNQISLLQHDPAGAAPLREFWAATSLRPADFMDEVYEARKLLLATSLAGDLETVSQGLLQIARGHRDTRDLTLGEIRRALTELIAHFPVYRTYAGAAGRSGEDERVFRVAMEGAGETLPEADWPALNRLDQWLGGEPLACTPPGAGRQLRKRVLARFQQLTSPAAAKAVEDTACYRAGVLLSRYDVGFNAQQFSTSVAAFHQHCRHRFEAFPDNLLTTATHDSKRGEDMRARLAVISERAEWSIGKFEVWRHLAEPLRRQLPDGVAPSPGDEMIIYQTLLGSWPLTLQTTDAEGCQRYLQRLLGWQQKALREAKLRSSWQVVNSAYENACADFLTSLLTATDGPGMGLSQSVARAAMTIASAGALNSLSQSLLRMSTPGVPDLYQGAEFWDFNLVDPDNRRAVDYTLREDSLASARRPAQLLAGWHDGGVKQWLVQQVLQTRRAHCQLFRRGRYLPLQVSGPAADHIVAFARYLDGVFAVLVAPIRCASMLGDCHQPLVPPWLWQDTVIELPDPLQTGSLFNVLNGEWVTASLHQLSVAELLAEFPVGLLLSMPPRPAPRTKPVASKPASVTRSGRSRPRNE